MDTRDITGYYPQSLLDIVQRPDGVTCHVKFLHPTDARKDVLKVLTKGEALFLKRWVDGAVNKALREAYGED